MDSKLTLSSRDIIQEIDFLNNPFFFEFFENFESKNTIRSYKSDINQFFNYVREYMFDVNSLKDLKRLHGIAYKKWLTENEYAPKTINRKLSSSSSFYDYLIEKSLVEYNIFDSIKRPKQVVKTPTNDLSDEEIISVFQKLDVSKSKSRFLHKAVVYVLFTTGIRKSELINLKLKDMHFEKGYWLINLKVKGGKFLSKVLPMKTYEIIQEYTEWMASQGREIHPEDWIFQPTKNPIDQGNLIKPLNPKTIDYILKKYCQSAGILKRISPHSARASYIGSALENGADLYKVSKDVGHESVKTTEEYDKRRKKISDSPIHNLGFLKD